MVDISSSFSLFLIIKHQPILPSNSIHTHNHFVSNTKITSSITFTSPSYCGVHNLLVSNYKPVTSINTSTISFSITTTSPPQLPPQSPPLSPCIQQPDSHLHKLLYNHLLNHLVGKKSKNVFRFLSFA